MKHEKSPQDVARRALCLAATVCRGSIDHGAGHPDAEDLVDRIDAWIRSLGIDTALESFEVRLLATPLGELPERDRIAATWSVEGLAILAWALGIDELPKHDTKVDPFAVTDSLYFLGSDATRVITDATLRSQQELSAYRELAYAMHCRLRAELRERQTTDFTNWIDPNDLELLVTKPSDLIIDQDLAIGDVSTHQAGRDQVEQCEWITTPRHRAIIWLVEGEPTYWDTPVDT
ncbi:MAG: DUF4272 domain-containing protein [Pirellulales bacterium]